MAGFADTKQEAACTTGEPESTQAMRLEEIRPDEKPNQCDEWPSSLVLVAKRIDTTNTTMITGTTKNGEVMSMAQTPEC
jgi:hypothetical protein